MREESICKAPQAKTIAEEFVDRINAERRREHLVRTAPLIVLIALALLGSFFVEGFFGLANLRNLLNQSSIPLVLVTGLAFVILVGSIDLSIEGVMGFSGSIVTLMVANSKNAMDLGLWAIPITIAAGTLFGALSGLLHVKLRIPSFIVTFGMGSVATGLGVLSYRGMPATVTDPLFASIAQGSFLHIPYLNWIALLVCGAGCFLQNSTAFGRAVYAIGDNEAVARSNGIRVDRVKIEAFAWCACCAAIAGVLGAIRLNRGEVIIGKDNLFTTITALVVGGVSLAGGSGGMFRALVGVVIVTVIQNCMILIGVDPYKQEAIKGVIIILAVALSVSRGRRVVVK